MGVDFGWVHVPYEWRLVEKFREFLQERKTLYSGGKRKYIYI